MPVIAGLLLAWLCPLAAEPPAAAETTETDDTPPATNLDYWLRQAEPADDTDKGITRGARPFGAGTGPAREDAVPGAVQLTDGRILAGWLYTTREQPWEVFDARTERWRRVPLAAILSVSAEVVREDMELEWRWKDMGVPERVYTGRMYPTRRLMWRFRLADGSTLTGAVKGRPLWILMPGGGRQGPFVLHERMRGEPGQGLDDLVHIRRAVVSRRVLELLEDQDGANRDGEESP